MIPSTSPAHAPATQPARPHSSWPVRAAFTLLFGALLAAGGTVALLVGFTFLRLTDATPGPTAPQNGEEQPIRRLVGVLLTNLENENAFDRHGPINILLIGMDEEDCREDLRTPGSNIRRADTMILVRVDPATERVAMLAIPRDLFVSIPGHGSKKINTAHMHGEADEVGGGPGLLSETVLANLGLSVHRWLRVDFEGFKDIVEAIDGVELEVPPPGLHDEQYPDGHCGTMVVDIPVGRQQLDPEQALQYARSRMTSSDFDRSARQMQVLVAIRDKALQWGTLPNVPDLMRAVDGTVDTNLTASEMLSLAKIARDISAPDVVRMQIDANVVYDEWFEIDGWLQSVLVLRPGPYEALRERFLAAGAETVAGSGTPTPQP